MKTLKNFGTFVNEQTYIEVSTLLPDFMEEYYPGDEYDYDIKPGWINVYHVDDGRGGLPEDLHGQVGEDNRVAAERLVNQLREEGWVFWEIENADYTGFTLIRKDN